MPAIHFILKCPFIVKPKGNPFSHYPFLIQINYNLRTYRRYYTLLFAGRHDHNCQQNTINKDIASNELFLHQI